MQVEEADQEADLQAVEGEVPLHQAKRSRERTNHALGREAQQAPELSHNPWNAQ